MVNILDLNDRYLTLLRERRQLDPSLTFTFRKSNYAGRLSEGFWFYGKETYLGISFWSGMDWRNRTPNIMVRIRDNGDMDLEVNVSDSDRKREFIERYLLQPLELAQIGRRYMRSIAANCNEEIATIELEKFLERSKPLIDEIIRRDGQSFFSELENSIGFISSEEFLESEAKINEYYEKLKNNTDSEEDRLGISKPTKIKSFRIWNYGPIDSLQLQDIPPNNQWVFITGENGTGKTNFLKSLAATLGYGGLGRRDDRVPHSSIELIHQKGDEVFTHDTFENHEIRARKPMVAGLCMYGPYRLKNTSKVGESKFKSLFNKNNSFKSLFTDYGFLLDLEKQFEIWQRKANTRQLLDKRKNYIREAIINTVPGLYDIRFSNDPNDRTTKYITRKANELGEEEFVNWEALASGTRSVLSLLADIMLRLYHQQPKIFDPSELRGVVIIDEIDLHLHPIAQKNLIENLSNTFREVQFIVTTHSPIPLLGAPRDSRIYVMRRNEFSLELIRMDDKVPFSRILPNGLLSSPIFGLEDLLPVSKEGNEIPFVEETFSEISFLNRLEKEVKAFLTNEKQVELINLFRKKDETNS
jgi:AAA15 family ATPase/GTPase